MQEVQCQLMEQQLVFNATSAKVCLTNIENRRKRTSFKGQPRTLENPLPSSTCGATYPVKHRKHHVELLLLLLLCHVTRRVAQFWEKAAQVHQAQRIVLGAALLLPRPPHDPLHHVHLERLCQGKGSPAEQRQEVNPSYGTLTPYRVEYINCFGQVPSQVPVFGESGNRTQLHLCLTLIWYLSYLVSP